MTRCMTQCLSALVFCFGGLAISAAIAQEHETYDFDGVAVWNAGCNGYYRSPSGRIVTQWPFSMKEYGDRTRTHCI